MSSRILPLILMVSIVLGLLALVPKFFSLALAGLVIFRALGRAPLVPVGDPYLAESLHYHQ